MADKILVPAPTSPFGRAASTMWASGTALANSREDRCVGGDIAGNSPGCRLPALFVRLHGLRSGAAHERVPC